MTCPFCLTSAEPSAHSHPYATRVSSSRRSIGSDGCGVGSTSSGSTASGSTGTQSDDDNENDRAKSTQGLDFNQGDFLEIYL